MAQRNLEESKVLTRQAMLEALDIGDTFSLAHRVDLSGGLNDGVIGHHVDTLRQIIDTQTHRARKKYRERKFSVENGHFVTRGCALIITVACTRVE